MQAKTNWLACWRPCAQLQCWQMLVCSWSMQQRLLPVYVVGIMRRQLTAVRLSFSAISTSS